MESEITSSFYRAFVQYRSEFDKKLRENVPEGLYERLERMLFGGWNTNGWEGKWNKFVEEEYMTFQRRNSQLSKYVDVWEFRRALAFHPIGRKVLDCLVPTDPSIEMMYPVVKEYFEKGLMKIKDIEKNLNKKQGD